MQLLDLRLSGLQDREPNKLLFFVNYPVCGILLVQQEADKDSPKAPSGRNSWHFPGAHTSLSLSNLLSPALSFHSYLLPRGLTTHSLEHILSNFFS